MDQSESKVICPRCQKQNDEDSRFCANCGLPQKQSYVLPTATPTPIPAQSRAPATGCLAWIGGCVVLVFAGIVGLAILGAILGPRHSTERSGSNPSQAQSASHSIPVRRSNTTVLNVDGANNSTTDYFSVGNEWDLKWSYDCTNFSNTGNFIVHVRNKGGGYSGFQSVNELGAQGSGTEHYHGESGTYYLEISSECKWAVKAVDRS